MKVTDADRYGCTMGGRRIKYSQLRWYVCNDCGGQPVHRFIDGDEVLCGACGGTEFIHERAYMEQEIDAADVLQNLPDLFAIQNG